MPLGESAAPVRLPEATSPTSTPHRARAAACKPEGRAGDTLPSSGHYLWGYRERRQSLSSAWTGT